jgi:hypothetical protein
MLPEQKAKLDARFGSLQPVRADRGEEKMGLNRWERNLDGTPSTHLRFMSVPDGRGNIPDLNSKEVQGFIDLAALRKGKRRYMWAVTEAGALRIGEEMVLVGHDAVLKAGASPYAGHPMLVCGGEARICGELGWNPATGRHFINNSSSGYSRYEDRTPERLNHVAGLFKDAKLDVEVQYKVYGKRIPLAAPKGGLS